jgi:hypothetical protein
LPGAGVGERGEHVVIEIVEWVDEGRRPAVVAVLRRWLTILGVVVPPSRDRLIAVHEVPEPLSLPAVEVLHLEGLVSSRFAGVDPIGEVAMVTEELIRCDRLDAEFVEEKTCPPTVRFRGHHRVVRKLGAVLTKCHPERVRSPVHDLETIDAQFVGEAAHRCEIEMCPLNVPRLRGDLLRGFDHEHSRVGRRRVGHCADRPVQLVTEDENGSHGERNAAETESATTTALSNPMSERCWRIRGREATQMHGTPRALERPAKPMMMPIPASSIVSRASRSMITRDPEDRIAARCSASLSAGSVDRPTVPSRVTTSDESSIRVVTFRSTSRR